MTDFNFSAAISSGANVVFLFSLIAMLAIMNGTRVQNLQYKALLILERLVKAEKEGNVKQVVKLSIDLNEVRKKFAGNMEFCSFKHNLEVHRERIAYGEILSVWDTCNRTTGF